MLLVVRLFIICLSILGCNVANAENAFNGLQPFHVKIESQNQSYFWVKFTIADDYHLYQSKINIVTNPDSAVTISEPELPDPIILPNVEASKSKIYEHELAIQVPISNYASGKLDLAISFQGCKGTTLCLPEQTINEKIDLTTGKSSIVADKPVDTDKGVAPTEINLSSNTNDIASYFNNSIAVVIGSFFALGLLIAFTPCVFPLLPILITVIAGDNISQRRSLGLAFSYILGGAVVYAAAGVLAAAIGHSIAIWFQSWWISLILALLFATFALSMFGVFEIQLPAALQQRLNNSVNKTKGGSLIGSFIIGGLSNLILSPCVTAPLAGALVYISTTGNQVLGGFALFALGFGSGLPLLIIAVFGKKFLPKSGSWMLVTKQILGLIMLAMTGYMISKVLSGYDDVIVIIWSLIAVLMLGRHIKFFAHPRMSKIAVALVFFIAIVAYKHTSDLKMQDVDQHFTTVSTVSELDQQLLKARMNKMPVVLDYYANWCSACKEMDLRTFSNKDIQQHFSKYAMIRVDVTNNTADVQQMQERYSIIALPSLVLLDGNGNQIQQLKSYGFITSNELMNKFNSFDQIINTTHCDQFAKC